MVFCKTKSEVSRTLTYIPQFALRTCELINDVRDKAKRNRVFRFKQGTDSVRIRKNEHEFGVRVELAE